jgi:S1-C subfamily serine protease
MTAAQIKDKYGPGVVQITAKVPLAVDGKVRWETRVGSGFVASKTGLIVTSDALVADAHRRGPMVRGLTSSTLPLWVTCEFWGGQGQYTKVRGFVCNVESTIQGCALIAVDPRTVHLTPIPLGDANRARVGEPVVVLHRWADLAGQLTSTSMKLTAVWRNVWTSSGKTVTALRTNSSLDRSSLGAPLIDTGGKVVGWVGPIPWLCFNDSTGDHSTSVANSACGVTQLRQMIEAMHFIHGGRKTWLDVYGTSVDDPYGLAKALGLPLSLGFLVEIVDPGGPAARAEIRGGNRVEMVDVTNMGPRQYLTGGDIIVAIDGKAVRWEGDYYDILAKHKPGETVRVKLYRGHRLLTVKVRVTAYPYTPAAG